MRVDLAQLVPYDDIRIVHSTFGSACYIEDSFPSLLYLAYKYAGAGGREREGGREGGGSSVQRGEDEAGREWRGEGERWRR